MRCPARRRGGTGLEVLRQTGSIGVWSAPQAAWQTPASCPENIRDNHLHLLHRRGKENRLIRQVWLKASRDVHSVGLNTTELLRGEKTYKAKQFNWRRRLPGRLAARATLTHIFNTHPRQNPIAEAAFSKLQQGSEKLGPAGKVFSNKTVSLRKTGTILAFPHSWLLCFFVYIILHFWKNCRI